MAINLDSRISKYCQGVDKYIKYLNEKPDEYKKTPNKIERKKQLKAKKLIEEQLRKLNVDRRKH